MFDPYYSCATLERLFRDYQHENSRANREEAETTQANITRELYRRLKNTLDGLDSAETEEDAIKWYRQFDDPMGLKNSRKI